MRKLEILCDLDSVVADLMTDWLFLYNQEYADNLTVDRITEWDTHLFTKEACGERIYSYLTADLFSRLNPLPGAVEAVTTIADKHTVHFITAAPVGTADAKVAWVEKYFPHLKHNVFTGKHKWKLRGDVLIDDYDENILNYKFYNPNAKTILMGYPYNEKSHQHESVDFVVDGSKPKEAWSDIISYISWLE
jgi:5'(3')-deoxyribonucleotidase